MNAGRNRNQVRHRSPGFFNTEQLASFSSRCSRFFGSRANRGMFDDSFNRKTLRGCISRTNLLSTGRDARWKEVV